MCDDAQTTSMNGVDVESSGDLKLHYVDQRAVAIQIPVGNRQRIIRGWASFATDVLGGLLTINCDDPAGPFQLLIRERDWTGRLEKDDSFGCDFLIRLALS